MTLVFDKYHGAGNDFIVIDNRRNDYILSSKSIHYLCDRHFGIGADGLIEILLSDEYDFYMRYYNADGKEGTMCGNGGRCAAAFAMKNGISDDHMVFETIDGTHEATIVQENPELIIRLSMNDVHEFEHYAGHYFIDTGSPHYVSFKEDPDQENFVTKARKIRYACKPEGTNVNFAKKDNNRILVRTYERGVEDETLACGTGVTAVALAAAKEDSLKKGAYEIHARGGVLKVYFEMSDNGFKHIWLEGPAAYVFSGQINL